MRIRRSKGGSWGAKRWVVIVVAVIDSGDGREFDWGMRWRVVDLGEEW